MTTHSKYETKRCNCCGEDRHISEYDRYRGDRAAYMRRCRSCCDAAAKSNYGTLNIAEYMRKWRVVAKEELKA